MGPFGFGNLGDAAIQDAVIHHLRARLPDVEIWGVSLNPSDTQARHGIPCLPIRKEAVQVRTAATSAEKWESAQSSTRFRGAKVKLMRFVRRIPLLRLAPTLSELIAECRLIRHSYTALKSIDSLIVSGGGQLDDDWGGAWEHPYALFKWSVLATLRGTTLLFLSVGAGPLKCALSRFFVKRALLRARYRSYRDEDSRQFVSRLGIGAPGLVYPDLAHSLPAPRVAMHSEHATVGIAPIPYCHPRIWPRHERDEQVYRAYVQKLAVFTCWLLDEGYRVKLLKGDIFQEIAVNDDLRKTVAHLRPAYEDLDRIVEPKLLTVTDLVGELSGCDMVVTSRLHVALLALSHQRPTIGISYHNKIDALFRNLGQSRFCLDIKTFEPEALKIGFASLSTERARVQRELRVRIAQYRHALDRQFDHVADLLGRHAKGDRGD